MRLSIYFLGGDLRFLVFIKRFLVVDFLSLVLFVFIIFFFFVEITCCCFRGFFRGEVLGGRLFVGMDRLLVSNVRDGDTVLVVSGGIVVIEKECIFVREIKYSGKFYLIYIKENN